MVSWDLLRVTLYCGEPIGRVKIQEMSENITRYYTLNRVIRDLLSKCKLVNFLATRGSSDIV